MNGSQDRHNREVRPFEPPEAQRRAVEQFAFIVRSPEFQSAMRSVKKNVKAALISLAPALEGTRKLAARLAPVFAAVVENLVPILERSVLPNWTLVELPDPELLQTILVDEGIALAWVPPPTF